ncbi:HYR domain-containing protein [Pollutibacter soli]|uniref:HYR domain-containing protein n=1 Tax=Pollutibacter soli TaxID=3034157 RepID=UPI003013CF4F
MAYLYSYLCFSPGKYFKSLSLVMCIFLINVFVTDAEAQTSQSFQSGQKKTAVINAANENRSTGELCTATASAGEDIRICATADLPLLSGTMGGSAIDPVWSGGAGTFSPNANTLNAKYIPSAAELANGGTIMLTLTVNTTDENCVVVADQMNYRIDPASLINAGPDQTVCATSVVQLNATLGGVATQMVWQKNVDFGVFIGPDTDPDAKFRFNANGQAQTSVKFKAFSNDPGDNVCPGGEDEVEIFILPAPIVSAGTDIRICATSTLPQLGGSISGTATSATWSGGAGTFSPNATTLNATYVPSTAELSSGAIIILTLTTNDPAGECPAATDQVEYRIDPAAIVNAGPDQTICATGVLQFNATLSGVATQMVWQKNVEFGTFITQDTRPDAQFVFNANGQAQTSVKFKAFTNDPGDNVCQGGEDEVEIFILATPKVEAGTNIRICAAAVLPKLAGSISGTATSATWSGGAGTFSPNANTLDATYNPSPSELANGAILTLTLTTNDPDGDCPAAVDQIEYRIDPAPIVNAGPDQTICATGVIQFNATLSGVATSMVWQKNVEFGTFITQDTRPDAQFVLNANGRAQTSVKFKAFTNDPGDNVCQGGEDEVEIFILPAPIVNAGTDIRICATANPPQLAGSISGTATSATWSGGTGTFSPDANTLNATYNPSAAELASGAILTLTLTTNDPDGDCPAATDQVEYRIDPASLINAGPDQTVCATSVINLKATLGGVADAMVWQKNVEFGTFITPDTETEAQFVLNANGQAQTSIKFKAFSSDPGNNVCSGGEDEVEIFILQPGNCPGECSITSASFSNISACNNNGTSNPGDDYFTADLTVNFQNPPSSGVLEIEPGNPNVLQTVSVPVSSLTGGTHTFTGIKLKATGAIFSVEIQFSVNQTNCVRTIAAPAVSGCSPLCIITSASLTNVSACQNNGTSDPADDYFTANLIVNFVNAPATGTLEVEAGNPNVLQAVSVPVSSVSGNSHTFTAIKLKSTGAPFAIEIQFSADEQNCVRTISAPAVAGCSNCTLTCPSDITQYTARGKCGAYVTFPQATKAGACGTLSYSISSGSYFAVGNTVVTVTSSSGATCNFIVRVIDNQKPELRYPPDISVNASSGSCSRQINFTVSATDNCPGVTVTTSPASGSVFPAGTTTVTATATDASGNKSTATFRVKVKENKAPSIQVKPQPIVLSGNADGSYRTLSLADCIQSVYDNCSQLNIRDVNIIKVTSDELENAPGNADGNTTKDIRIASDCKSVQLRKERMSTGNGRVYTIYFAVSDASGNTGTNKIKVYVPKTQGATTAVENWPIYWEFCYCGFDFLFGWDWRTADGVQLQQQPEPLAIVQEFTLEQNAPNPSNSNTVIRYSVPITTRIQIAVYSLQGQKLIQLVDGQMNAGIHQINLATQKLASGTYLYRLEAKDQNGNPVILNRKMVVSR